MGLYYAVYAEVYAHSSIYLTNINNNIIDFWFNG